MEPVGPTMSLPTTAVGFFILFFSVALVRVLVEETNAYAANVLGDVVEVKWKDVNEDDIWAFLGFALLMGINWLPQLRMYWSERYSFLPIAERIPRDRFFNIWRYLHFTSITPPPPPPPAMAACASPSPSGPTHTPDRLYKVRPIISAVVAACRANYRPNREQAIDEAMVAFNGRSSMKQYNPIKPVKRGFKIWVRADSHNGYVCEFECYTGRKDGTAEKGLDGSVVTRLTRDLVGKSYQIFMDNFFSISLYRALLFDRIYCTGTARSCRRNFPPDLKDVAKRGLAWPGLQG